MTIDEVVKVENASITAFLHRHADHLAGRVLDFGCGRQPYRQLIEQAGGTYTGYDRTDFPANMSGRDVGNDRDLYREYDAIVCTQVAQFWEMPDEELGFLRSRLADSGRLLISWPTNWPEVNDTDLWRFTAAGMRMLLAGAGFTVELVERRASFEVGDLQLAYGYGAVAAA